MPAQKPTQRMFVTVLFATAKTWKKLLIRCPSGGEWISKLWYIQTMEHYLALKINELLNHKKLWRKHKRILLMREKPV